MLAGVSCRRYRRTREPVGEQVEREAHSTSKSAASRQFFARTRDKLEAPLHRRLDDVRPAVLIVDGIDLKGRTNPVALGISTEGIKIPLGLRGSSTENASVATALISDLIDRALDVEQGVLCAPDETLTLQRLGIRSARVRARLINPVSIDRRWKRRDFRRPHGARRTASQPLGTPREGARDKLDHPPACTSCDDFRTSTIA